MGARRRCGLPSLTYGTGLSSWRKLRLVRNDALVLHKSMILQKRALILDTFSCARSTCERGRATCGRVLA